MESTKTKELRSRKNSVRSKLMAAVAMLLVSTILLSSTTYAWFVLSTAPEVKGMSTTVGANGSLEIALLNNETGADTSLITTGASDSMAVANADVTRSNITWGNLVSLDNAAYGLSGVTLYPARLNWDTSSNYTQLKSRNVMLSYPEYGIDGRVATLSDTEAGVFEDPSFVVQDNNGGYGVRAVGSVTQLTQAAADLRAVKASYNSATQTAFNAVQNAMTAQAKGMANIAIKYATNRGAGTVTFTQAEVDTIDTSLQGLKNSTNSIEEALKWAVAVRQTSEGNTTTSIDGITLTNDDTTVGTAYGALTTLRENLNNVTIPGGKEEYTWAEISGAYNALFDSSSMKVSGKTVEEIEAMDSSAQMTWGASLISSGADIVYTKGYYANTAAFVGKLKTNVSGLSVSYGGLDADNIFGTVTVEPYFASGQTETYIATVNTRVSAMNPADSTDESKVITTTYGYAVDLAFKCNTNAELQLSSTAMQRVNSSYEAGTMGEGTVFKITSADPDQKALDAMRFVFIDSSNTVLAIGKLGLLSEDGTTCAMNLFDWSVDSTTGKLVLDTANPVENNAITNLTAGQVKTISVLVYMDGDYIDSLNDPIEGTLNLQFCTDAELDAMDYSGYQGAPEGLADSFTVADATVAVGEKVNLSAIFNGQKVSAIWAVDPTDTSYANIVSVDQSTGEVTGLAAGTAKVGAVYTTAAGEQKIASCTVTVTN